MEIVQWTEFRYIKYTHVETLQVRNDNSNGSKRFRSQEAKQREVQYTQAHTHSISTHTHTHTLQLPEIFKNMFWGLREFASSSRFSTDGSSE